MKFIKTRLRNKDNKERNIIYPDGHRNLFYEKAGYINMEGVGDGISYVVGAIDETKKANKLPLAQVLESPDVVEMTKQEMIEFVNEKDPVKEEVTNQAVVQRLAIKATLGDKFTDQELKAIDPEDDEPGFGKSKNLANSFELL